jgi:hypothetical protein
MQAHNKLADMIVTSIAQAIEKCGKSRYQISKDTGIDQAILCRVVNGGTCGLRTADKLCEYLGLELRPRQAKGR